MAFVNAKCPNCGAALLINQTNDAAICQYCNTPFVVAKAVNNFNISANHVSLSGNIDSGFDIYEGKLLKYHGHSLHPIIPDGVHTIGEYAFAGTEEEVVRKDKLKLIDEKTFRPYYETIEHRFEEWTGLPIVGIDIPNTVKTIQHNAFKNCSKLEEIRLPSSVNNIDSPFFHCTGKLIIGDGTRIILCSHLLYSDFWAISIPDSVEEIGPDCPFNNIEYIDAHFPFTCIVTIKKMFRTQKITKTFRNEREMIRFFRT